MLPKEFIKITFLGQYKKIAYEYHYISFVLIAIGIEFLGKCLDDDATWEQGSKSKMHFNLAIDTLMPKYTPYKDIYNLCDSLRNGMAHALLPKSKIGLTNREEAKKYYNYNLRIKGDTLVLVAEDFYDDFAKACETILDIPFSENSKMNKLVLLTPTPLV